MVKRLLPATRSSPIALQLQVLPTSQSCICIRCINLVSVKDTVGPQEFAPFSVETSLAKRPNERPCVGPAANLPSAKNNGPGCRLPTCPRRHNDDKPLSLSGTSDSSSSRRWTYLSAHFSSSRHGIAAHNVHDVHGQRPDLHNPRYFDPPLIGRGKMGAIEAGEAIETWWKTTQVGETIELIVCSPLTRCLQTALVAFLPGGEYQEPRRIMAIESVREAYGMHYPDRRRSISLLKVRPSLYIGQYEVQQV